MVTDSTRSVIASDRNPVSCNRGGAEPVSGQVAAT
jgi:hypothetical protein